MTSKRQVTFPREVTDKLSLKKGDVLHLSATPDGILIRPHRFDPEKLAPLRDKINRDTPAPDFEAIRHASSSDPSLRH